jgi:hypothetical protein
MSIEREPVRTATGISAAVVAILTVFFLLARDMGIAIAQDTQAAITAAATIIALFLANEWARNRATPTAAPVLAAGTQVTTPSGTSAVVRKSERTDI